MADFNDQGSADVMDVWDHRTFQPDILDVLESHGDMICAYFTTENAIFLEHDMGRGSGRGMLRPRNPYSGAYLDLCERLGDRLLKETIRAYHYTRLIDAEVADLRRSGIHISTETSLRRRLDAMVASANLNPDLAASLYAESPLHCDQHDARTGKFWMNSNPVPVDDHKVMPLMARWGGEVASFAVSDEGMLKPLGDIGRARVIEVAAPLEATQQAYSASQAAIATFARFLGAAPDKSDFDLYVRKPLPATAVLAVHTEGEPSFAQMGKSYPAGYVDVSAGYWKELTGEDD